MANEKPPAWTPSSGQIGQVPLSLSQDVDASGVHPASGQDARTLAAAIVRANQPVINRFVAMQRQHIEIGEKDVHRAVLPLEGMEVYYSQVQGLERMHYHISPEAAAPPLPVLESIAELKPPAIVLPEVPKPELPPEPKIPVLEEPVEKPPEKLEPPDIPPYVPVVPVVAPRGFIVAGRWYGKDAPHVLGDGPAPTVFGTAAKLYDVDGKLISTIKSPGGGGSVGIAAGLDDEGNRINGARFIQCAVFSAVIDNKSNSIIGFESLNSRGQSAFVKGPFICKFDPHGSLLWGYEQVEESKNCTGLDCDKAGNVFFAWTRETGEIPVMVTPHIGKLDSNGKLLWQKEFDAEVDGFAGIVCSRDGYSFFNGGSAPNAPKLSAYDPSGKPLWTLSNWFALGCAGDDLAVQNATRTDIGKVNIFTGKFIWSHTVAIDIVGADIASNGDVFFLDSTDAQNYAVGCLASNGILKYTLAISIPVDTRYNVTIYGPVCSGTRFALFTDKLVYSYDFAPRDDAEHDEWSFQIYDQKTGTRLKDIPWGRFYSGGIGSTQRLYPIDYRLDADEISVIGRASPQIF